MNASVTTRVQEIIERGVGRSLVDLAWEHTSEPHLVRELYAALRRREPKTALESLRVRFLEEEHYRRDGKVFRREMYETIEALGDTGVRWLPYFVAHADLAAFSMVLGRLGDARAVPALMERLRVAKGPLLAAVIDALGWLRAASAVDALIDVAHSALPDDERDRIGHRRVVANACLALGRIGDPRAMGSLVALVEDPPPEMESVVPRAIVALGWLGEGVAAHALLPLLEGRYRNVAMYALTRIADRASASHVEAAFARVSGPPEQVVYPRLMLEALRSRLGRSVDVTVAQYALSVVMANRFEAAELHETALRILAVHGRPAELVPLARRFLDAEHPRVRAAAVGAIASAGVVASPSWFDRPRTLEIYRREGVRGLASALADPDGVFRHNVVRKAAEEECGAELEGPALGAVRGMVAFPHYSEAAVVDRPENTFDALEALARFHTLATDQFLSSLLDHPNAVVRAMVTEIAKIDIYGASEYLRHALRARVEAQGAPRPTLPVARLGGGPWVFGPAVRAIAIERAGTRVVVVGDERVAFFDADGTLVAMHDGFADVVAAAFDRPGERAAVVTRGGQAVVFNGRTGEFSSMVSVEGAPGVTAAVISTDGHVLVGTKGGRLVKAAFPIDSKASRAPVVVAHASHGVAWQRRASGPVVAMALHAELPRVLVATKNRVLAFDERDGAVHARTPTSRATIVDVVAHGPTNAVAVLTTADLTVFDATTLAPRFRVALRGGARAAFAREGEAVLVATRGKRSGIVRVDLATKKTTSFAQHSRAIHALVVDPVSGFALSGGDGVRVELWDQEGGRSSLPIAQHEGRVVAVVADPGRDRAFSFGEDERVLQWDIATREIVAGWRLPDGLAPHGAALGANGRAMFVVGARVVAELDLVTGSVAWRRALTTPRAILGDGSEARVLSGRGLLGIDEAEKRLVPLVPTLKSGCLAAVDDARAAVADAARVTVFALKSGAIVSRLAHKRGRPTFAAGGDEVGLVIATDRRWLARFVGDPLASAEAVRLPALATALAVSPASARVAVALGRDVVVLEADLHERARVRLEYPVSAMAFADGRLLVCGGDGGEVAIVETDR